MIVRIADKTALIKEMPGLVKDMPAAPVIWRSSTPDEWRNALNAPSGQSYGYTRSLASEIVRESLDDELQSWMQIGFSTFSDIDNHLDAIDELPE